MEVVVAVVGIQVQQLVLVEMEIHQQRHQVKEIMAVLEVLLMVAVVAVVEQVPLAEQDLVVLLEMVVLAH